MATVINNPNPPSEIREIRTSDTGSNTNFIIGLILVVLLAILFFAYGLPALRDRGGTNINVPDRVDVNLNQGQGQPSQ